MENGNCIWIGIGTDAQKESPLYCAVQEANAFLVKNYKGKAGFAGSEHPHLNLFDLSVPRKNLNITIQKIKEIAQQQRNFAVKTGKIAYFPFGLFFLEIENSEILLNLHKQIVEQVALFKEDCIDKDYLAPHRKYNQKQKDMLMEYGNPYVLDQFQPHITVGFVRDEESKLAEICKKMNVFTWPREFCIDNIHITAGDGRERTAEIFNLKN